MIPQKYWENKIYYSIRWTNLKKYFHYFDTTVFWQYDMRCGQLCYTIGLCWELVYRMDGHYIANTWRDQLLTVWWCLSTAEWQDWYLRL